MSSKRAGSLRSIGPMQENNVTIVDTMSLSGSVNYAEANKENFVPSMADRIKQGRRSATKMYRSPPKHQQIRIPRSKSQKSAMSIDNAPPALASPLKRRQTFDDVQQQSYKRVRSHSAPRFPEPRKASKATAQIPDSLVLVDSYEVTPLWTIKSSACPVDARGAASHSYPLNPGGAAPIVKVASRVSLPSFSVAFLFEALSGTISDSSTLRELSSVAGSSTTLHGDAPERNSPVATTPDDTDNIVVSSQAHEYTDADDSASVEFSLEHETSHRGAHVLTLPSAREPPVSRRQSSGRPSQPRLDSVNEHEDVGPKDVIVVATHSPGGPLTKSPTFHPLSQASTPPERDRTLDAEDVIAVTPADRHSSPVVELETSVKQTHNDSTDCSTPRSCNGPCETLLKNHKTGSAPAQAPETVPLNLKVLQAMEADAFPDTTADQQFVDQVKAVLSKQSKWQKLSVARRQAGRILQLLELAEAPTPTEALFLSGNEAARYLQTTRFFPGPIITKDQQPSPLQTTTQFLDEFYDDEAKVSIQDPSALQSRNNSVREVTIKQLKERFAKGEPKVPWNCLELATHEEDGLRPAFLSNEDCRLLTKLKHPSNDDQASRRGYEPGWKEVEKWALIAQGGALTEPHQDSHGYNTYITVNQGIMGFGWLARPTVAERKEWLKNPSNFKGGRWRYAVLRPGHTVYFPSGTVHFVFRLRSAGDTLAFGGHVLRCSQIVNWVKTMRDEKRARAITNEEITVSAPAYLERVERFVKQARRMGQAGKWGGQDAITEFLRVKEKFMSMPAQR
ncbi:hypothetical protein LTR37_008180 [Vermiconidia calcicola]|uniref:Uncharacterized protein n=1 Tax=Vermiconidia calcicola TaxID=1690605 RepID=A0ACC3NEA2_9PEZI|nr:hypothetical protein LTR37_008180 [Vermiconidia calcicola]